VLKSGSGYEQGDSELLYSSSHKTDRTLFVNGKIYCFSFAILSSFIHSKGSRLVSIRRHLEAVLLTLRTWLDGGGPHKRLQSRLVNLQLGRPI
jgi:hypothetical protein